MSRESADVGGPGQDLHQQVEALKRRKEELSRRLEAQQAKNKRMRRLLEAPPPGAKKRRRWLVTLVLVAVGLNLAAGLVGFQVLQHQRDTSMLGVVSQPLVPHLLLTSAPVMAEVLVDGEVRGKTPLLLGMPGAARRFLVEVRAAGYRPARRQMVTSERGGQHWHAVLGRASAGDPGP